MPRIISRLWILTLSILTLLGIAAGSFPASAQDSPNDAASIAFGSHPNLEVVSQEKWGKIDESVDRALNWLADRQQKDGSIPTYVSGQPGVTSLAILAFLSQGEQPGESKRGRVISRAIDYVLASQRPDGLFVVDTTNLAATQFERGAHTAPYNHAIACLALCEAYGATDSLQEPKLRAAIQRGLAVARKLQLRKQRYPEEQGGFRYYKSVNGYNGQGDADLSVTGWFVMFYRSAKNAGFEVPKEYMDDAISYVRRCYEPRQRAFYYGLRGDSRTTIARAMTGVGIVCLCASGEPDVEMAIAAGDRLLQWPFSRYGGEVGVHDRFHYGAYYCSQATLLLGNKHWSKMYPTLADTLLNNQNPDGSWPPEAKYNDGIFGSEYTTPLSILTLTSPYQLLPIHQR